RRLRQFCKEEVAPTPRYLELHGDAVEAELLRDAGDDDAARLLAKARAGYEAIGARSCGARMAVAEVLAGGGTEPKKLERLCGQERYGFESAWLDSRSSGYYPLHVT